MAQENRKIFFKCAYFSTISPQKQGKFGMLFLFQICFIKISDFLLKTEQDHTNNAGKQPPCNTNPWFARFQTTPDKAS
jgi:hypothetical protein